jgi:hypothetical protein
MAQNPKRLPVGLQTFSEIIEDNWYYVDKTSYIAKMIAGEGKAWFLARPRRFGKSLTLSTIKAVFSGDRALFKGLDIEPRLGEAPFAPRPVIRLDMLKVCTSGRPAGLGEALGDMTFYAAEDLGVEVPDNQAPGGMLESLVASLARKTGQPVAVLIDEYDRSFTDFLGKPDRMERARQVLRGYYSPLKAADDRISFIFITGVSRLSRPSLFPGAITDISIDPAYGALCGFTHDEVVRNFGRRLEDAAESLKMAPEQLAERMRSFYEGFCFDGETKVHNPFSALQFIRDRAFWNYWYETGSPERLAEYMGERRLTVERFRGLEISRGFARDPGDVGQTPPEGFLNQSGYLSLRPGRSPDTFRLDYPNQEVYGAVCQLWVAGHYGDANRSALAIDALRPAFASGGAEAVVKGLNKLLARIPCDGYADALQQCALQPGSGSPAPKADWRERFYRASLLACLGGAGLDARKEVHGPPGRTDMVVESKGRVWVLELKACREAGDDQETAEAALAGILEGARGHGEDAVALGMAMDCGRRAITAWRVAGGVPGGWRRRSEGRRGAGGRAAAEEVHINPRPRP